MYIYIYIAYQTPRWKMDLAAVTLFISVSMVPHAW